MRQIAGDWRTRPHQQPFATERFDAKYAVWRLDADGPLTGANQALSFIVYTSDLARLQQRFPGLELMEKRPLTNGRCYLLAGELNFRALVPASLARAVCGVDVLAAPMARWLAQRQLIVLSPTVPREPSA